MNIDKALKILRYKELMKLCENSIVGTLQESILRTHEYIENANIEVRVIYKLCGM